GPSLPLGHGRVRARRRPGGRLEQRHVALPARRRAPARRVAALPNEGARGRRPPALALAEVRRRVRRRRTHRRSHRRSRPPEDDDKEEARGKETMSQFSVLSFQFSAKAEALTENSKLKTQN